MLVSLGPRKLRPTFEPLRLFVVLDPPEVDAFGLTGTPNELTVNEAERLKRERNFLNSEKSEISCENGM